MAAHLTRSSSGSQLNPVASPSGRQALPLRPAAPLGAARMRRPSAPAPVHRLLRPPHAGLRLVEPGDSDSAVPYSSPEQTAAFYAALADPDMCATVLAQAKAAGRGGGAARAVWVQGAAFVPSAWSPATPRGVPPAWNDLAGRDDYVVIQVPPPVTYSVRVPGRVCAIYRLE